MKTLSMEDALKKAQKYAEELIQPAEEIRLEEVIFDEKKDQWNFTFSYYTEPVNEFERIVAKNIRRMKTIEISAESGEFVSMKMKD